MLLACGSDGEGSAVLAWLIALGALSIWAAGTVLIIKSARDRKEKRLLVALLVGSIVLGPALIAAYYQGFFGDDSSTGKLAVVLLVPGAIGAGIAIATRAGHGLRAFLASTWGAIFLGGAGTILFIAAIVGGACLE